VASSGWSEFWRYRELLYFLAARDIKVRYKQAALGVAWAIVQPLMTMLVFTLFFGNMAKIPSDGVPYPLFSFCGLVAWMYFASTVAIASNSLVSNASLLTKVYFPRLFLPAAAAIGTLLDFGVSLILLFLLMAWYGVVPGLTALAAPLIVFVMVLQALGVSMLLAAINVRFRDIKHVIPFGIQLWLFATPVIYPLSFLPADLRVLAALNPMAGIVENFRASLLGTGPLNWGTLTISTFFGVGLFGLGLLYFQHAERRFADIV
jgi:lipopolysaccharide transport system permease protein